MTNDFLKKSKIKGTSEEHLPTHPIITEGNMGRLRRAPASPARSGIMGTTWNSASASQPGGV